MAPTDSSRIPGFYDLPQAQRRERVLTAAGLPPSAGATFEGAAGLHPDQADHMIENVVGLYSLPLGVAVNFTINGRDYLIPMAIEEPSVVAGASFMARIVREAGGFQASAPSPVMIGQIQILDLPDLDRARQAIADHEAEILRLVDEVDPVIRKVGGGARGIEVRTLPETAAGPMLIVHILYDVRDAMGANAVNTAAERLAPLLERYTGGRVHLRILSNLADRRLARAACQIPADLLAFDSFTGEQVRDGILEAWAFAAADPYRAATHNKGIMNGVDAVVLATGNDWRAVEAGAHAYAARSGRYTSLSTWGVGPAGELTGELEMPVAVGIVGGATQVHPVARACLRLLGVRTACELAEVIVSVGLAQNLAALRALATEGIQRGHMGLHARQVAIAAGAEGARIETVARRLVEEGTVRVDRAQEILADMAGRNTV